eukprot:GEZU01032968.1.p1 GENE.GEZU01032968.1~~GEZU01032968.1.p1  ORF type:complete len:237 (+),score=73.87 GEZU01032968.1:64-774(+)
MALPKESIDDIEIKEEEWNNNAEMDGEDGGNKNNNDATPSLKFAPMKPSDMREGVKFETREVKVPVKRLAALKKQWMDIYTPIVEQLKLQIRYNTKKKAVEIRTCKQTEDATAIQKAADFVDAFCIGFEIKDSIALIRLDDLYIDSFEIKDVKNLKGDNLSRAIARIAGKNGTTKFTIENTTRTRIVLADTKISILGTYSNIRVAKDAIVDLILGSPASKVYGKLRTVMSRMRETL